MCHCRDATDLALVGREGMKSKCQERLDLALLLALQCRWPLVPLLGWDTSTPCIKGEVQKQVNYFQTLPLPAPVCLGLSSSRCFLVQFWEAEPSFCCLLSPGAAAAPAGMPSAVPEGAQRSVWCWGQCGLPWRGGGGSSALVGGKHTHFGVPPCLLLQCKQQVLVSGRSGGVSEVLCVLSCVV